MFFDKRMMSDLIIFCETMSEFSLSFAVQWNFGNKLRKMNFKFSQNSLISFNLGIYCKIKICPGFIFSLIYIFWYYYWNSLELKVFVFKIHWNTLIRVFYLKGKWLLSQDQQVRNDFFGYRWYEALAKHIKLFSKKH